LRDYADPLRGVDPEDKWIVFVGKAAYFKGQDLLLAALVKVQAKMSNGHKVHLMLIGNDGTETIYAKDPFTGEDVGTIVHKELAQNLGLQDTVHHLGRLPFKDMPRFIGSADAYMLSSRQEPFGLVAPEGMASGATPILTHGGGFVNIVARYPGDPTDVARFVLDDDPETVRVWRAAQQVAALEDSALKKDVVRLLGEAVVDEATGRFRLSQEALGDGQAAKELRALLRRVSHDMVVDSIAEGIVAEFSQTAEERTRRRGLAEEFARRFWSGRAMILDHNLPVLQRLMASDSRADLSLDIPAVTGPFHLKRQERLEALERAGVDTDVNSALIALQQVLSRRDATTGMGWRRFYATVATYLGSRSGFLHPFDPQAFGFQQPHTVLEEVARVSGVTTPQLRAVMHEVSKMPPSVLLGEPTPVHLMQSQGGRPPHAQAGFVSLDILGKPFFIAYDLAQSVVHTAQRMLAAGREVVRGPQVMYHIRLPAWERSPWPIRRMDTPQGPSRRTMPRSHWERSDVARHAHVR
jgi:hypothetical protein